MLKRIVLMLIFAALAAPTLAVETGNKAPEWTGTLLEGGEVQFPTATLGKPTILVFWATWCPYCKAFMPYLKEIQEEYGEEKINIVGINAKERGAGDPAAYVKTLGFPLIGVADGDDIAEAYAVHFIPGLMIVDAAGNIAWKRAATDLPAGKTVGQLWGEQVREQLDQLL